MASSHTLLTDCILHYRPLVPPHLLCTFLPAPKSALTPLAPREREGVGSSVVWWNTTSTTELV
jgi:hypothetical protein